MTEGDDKNKAPMFKSSLDDKSSGAGRLAVFGVALVAVIGGILYVSRGGGTTGGAPVAPSVKKEPPKPVDVPVGATAKVAGASFKMGSEEGDPDEKPIHDVTVKDFEIDLTEIRVSDYRKCVDAGKCTPPNPGQYCNWSPDKDAHPINCVDASQAEAYCKFVGKRLPTEEEWELAAHGTDGRKYPWKQGEPVDQLCWNGEGNDVGKSQRQGTCPVASYPEGRSAVGAYDMAGNVWEWTATPYCPYDKPDCGDDRRVIRGGGWNNLVSSYVRTSDRAKEKATNRVDNVGLRCAK